MTGRWTGTPTHPPPAAATPRYLELDALRGMAAVAVVLFHFTMDRPEAAYGFRFGVTGVDLFFIISGFVIFLTLEKTRSWKDFLVSRFSRLYPAYWTSVSLCALASLARSGSAPSPGDLGIRYLANLTMAQRYFGQEHLDGSYWTLTVELLFYALMLGIFSLKRLRSIESIAAGALLLESAYASPFFLASWPEAFRLLGDRFPLVNHLPLFLAGMLLFRLKTLGPSWPRYALIAACFVCQGKLYGLGGTARYYVSLTEYRILIAAYFALFLLYAQGRLRGLANPFTLYLGEISFSLYLCHQYLGRTVLLEGLMDRYHIGFRSAAAVALAGVFALATLITRWVERPALRAIRECWRRRAVSPIGTGN